MATRLPAPTRDEITQAGLKIMAENPFFAVGEAEIRSGYETQVSMRRFMDAADVAGAVVYMASPAGRHVSGQVLSVDGATESLRSS